MEHFGTWQDIVSAVSAGLLLDVEFNQAVNRHPGYMYSGMRGRLVAASFSGDKGEVRLKVDLQPFRGFNRMSERRMYCDAKALQADKARGKGIYPDDHCATLDVDAGHPVAGLLRPLAREGYRLYAEYRGAARDPDLSYPRWLEARALGAEQTSAGFASRPVAGQEIALPGFITVGELAAKLGVKTLPVILALTKCGIMATINQTLDHDTAALVLIDLGFKIKPQPELPGATGIKEPIAGEARADETSRVPPRPPAAHTEEPWPEFRIGIISQADFERARLCVNACAGRDPQQLRTLADQASGAEAPKALEERNDAVSQRASRLEEMRDSVWSVLQRLRDDLRRDDPAGHFDLVCDALAEVEGLRNEPDGLLVEQEPKYTVRHGRIVNRASGMPIPDQEPIFIFRAKDDLAIAALRAYAEEIRQGVATGGSDAARKAGHLAAVETRIGHFASFKARHPSSMKLPDTASGENSSGHSSVVGG